MPDVRVLGRQQQGFNATVCQAQVYLHLLQVFTSRLLVAVRKALERRGKHEEGDTDSRYSVVSSGAVASEPSEFTETLQTLMVAQAGEGVVSVPSLLPFPEHILSSLERSVRPDWEQLASAGSRSPPGRTGCCSVVVEQPVWKRGSSHG